MPRFLLPLVVLLMPMLIYLLWAALRASRLLVGEKNGLHTALSTLALFILPFALQYAVFHDAIAVMLLAAHLALFLLAEQIIYSIIMRLRRKRLKRQKLWRVLLCRVEYASPSRLHRSGLIPLLCVALLFVYGYVNMCTIVKTTYSVETDCIVPNGAYRLALVSDLHFGAVHGEEKLRALSEELSAQELDLLVLCGDIVDESSTREQMQCAFALLGGVSARDGVYYVLGNHDRASYRADPNYTFEELQEALRSSGITLLQDACVQLHDGLQLLGREDRSRRRLPTKQLLESVPEDEFVILLDHQPVELKENTAAGADLMLSGHTHGGQFFPLGYINTMISPNEICYGMRKVDGMTAIVSSGVSGWGVPLRTQAHSEYVLVDIHQVP